MKNLQINTILIYSKAWHLRLRQYYPGQEVINEHNDPNLAETPHYKEKQTILPKPLSAEEHIEKKVQTPVKRAHDGKIKKEKKDPYKSPVINAETMDCSPKECSPKECSPKEACIKSDEAKIDMRKLIIEHKLHKKHSESSKLSSSKTHSSSSSSTTPSSSSSKKEKSKHKSHSSDSHRSHSSKKSSSSSSSSSHSSDKHGRNESRKSSNHSSSSTEKHKSLSSSEISSKKVETSIAHTNTNSQPVIQESIASNTNDVKPSELIKVESPIEVSSTFSNAPLPASIAQNASESHMMPCIAEPPQPPMPPSPFNLLPPLPTGEMPIEIAPPPPPPPEDDCQSINKSSISPDSSTQQMPSSPAPKVRKVSSSAATKSDLLGSIMASMDSPRNGSNI